jgi:RimJ/RimL family protein N-acetyltransferase
MSRQNLPTIAKSPRIQGKTLVLREANIEDAAFILNLRTDQQKAKYLSTTDADLDKQRAWLAVYANQTNQAYFIIEDIQAQPLGTVRLYDAQGSSFCWGSWIIKDGAPSTTAIESALIVYSYALDVLGFTQAHFDVRRGNESVWKFHERFGAVRTHATEHDFIYTIDQIAINAARKKYSKFSPNKLQIGNK